MGSLTYPQTIKYLESFVNYEQIKRYSYKKSFGLERIKGFLRSIDNPEQNLKVIHVAGSKGKGSTCAFIAHILKEAGFKVGLYTSPHLSDFRERIRVLTPKQSVALRDRYKHKFADGTSTNSQTVLDFEGMISRKVLARLIERLKPAIGKYNQESEYGQLSFFEIWTALAFVYFKESKTDFVVLETGLGGRLDATNVTSALVSVITPISYEHTRYLGNTLKKIAEEKAGIIKSHKSQVTSHKSIVISAPQEKEAMRVIMDRCKKAGAELYVIGRQIKFHDFKIRLLGKHQLINANVAQAVVKALKADGVKISDGVIRKGLYNTFWPGRCEVFSRSPLIVLDGAHNIASANVLRTAIKENFRYNNLILIFGACFDKDIKGMLSHLAGFADKIIFTSAGHERSVDPKSLPIAIKIPPNPPFSKGGTGGFKKRRFQMRKNIYITDTVREAKQLAVRLAKKNDLILVTGSLYIVGAFRDV